MGAAGFNKDLNEPAIPLIKGVGFMGGDILLGGTGSDTLEGKRGDDLIDGDRWLNVQLRAGMNPVEGAPAIQVRRQPRRTGRRHLLRIRSGSTRATSRSSRHIVTPSVPAADCNARQARREPPNCDTAVFSFPAADYDITARRSASDRDDIPATPADAAASTASTRC